MVIKFIYYYSLPEFPKECKIIKDNSIILRDLFLCVNNYHYEYPRFEDFSYDDICRGRNIRKLLKSKDPDNYILLFTRYRFLNRKEKSYIIGYFKVGEKYLRKFKNLRKSVNKESWGFEASEVFLIRRNEDFLTDYNYRSVPSSDGTGEMSKELPNILNKFLNLNPELNVKDLYQSETNRIINLLTTEKGLKFIERNCINGSCNTKKCHLRKVLKRVSSQGKIYGLDYLRHFYNENYHIGFIFDKLRKNPL